MIVATKLNDTKLKLAFFVFLWRCSALQIPPEAWLRISLNHASITWLTIQPSGRVTLRQLGDSGHMPLDLVTSR